jgi:hypothetical protein
MCREKEGKINVSAPGGVNSRISGYLSVRVQRFRVQRLGVVFYSHTSFIQNS